jgi:hypothetical protein
VLYIEATRSDASEARLRIAVHVKGITVENETARYCSERPSIREVRFLLSNENCISDTAPREQRYVKVQGSRSAFLRERGLNEEHTMDGNDRISHHDSYDKLGARHDERTATGGIDAKHDAVDDEQSGNSAKSIVAERVG